MYGGLCFLCRYYISYVMAIFSNDSFPMKIVTQMCGIARCIVTINNLVCGCVKVKDHSPCVETGRCYMYGARQAWNHSPEFQDIPLAIAFAQTHTHI